MKIYEGQSPIFQEGGKKQNSQGVSGSEFQKIMDQVTPASGKTDAVSGKESLGAPSNGVQIVQGLDQMSGAESSNRKTQILDELKNTLDLVDFYANKLGDASISAKGLSPLLGHLEDRMEGLRDTGASPETPEKLRSIISDMTITIGSEIEKFRRGDYS